MTSKIFKLFTFLFGSAIVAVGAAHGKTSIEVTANDTMQYSAKVFEVTAGEEVTTGI